MFEYVGLVFDPGQVVGIFPVRKKTVLFQGLEAVSKSWSLRPALSSLLFLYLDLVVLTQPHFSWYRGKSITADSGQS